MQNKTISDMVDEEELFTRPFDSMRLVGNGIKPSTASFYCVKNIRPKMGAQPEYGPVNIIHGRSAEGMQLLELMDKDVTFIIPRWSLYDLVLIMDSLGIPVDAVSSLRGRELTSKCVELIIDKKKNG